MKKKNGRLPLFVILLLFCVITTHAKAQPFYLDKVADYNTPIPAGSVNFDGFFNLGISGGNVAFKGWGPNGELGIYLFKGITLVKVADSNTPIPGGIGNFVDFDTVGSPVISGGRVAFFGRGLLGQRGIYLYNGTTLGKVADLNTPIPAGEGNFLDLSDPAISGGNVVFEGFGVMPPYQGIYLFNGTSLTVVADGNTAISEGSGNFAGFFGAVISGGNVAFRGGADRDQEGIYLFDGTTVKKVMDRNTAILEGSGNFITFSSPVISGGNVAFYGFGTDWQRGIYLFNGTILTRVVDPNTTIPDGTGNFEYFDVLEIGGGNLVFDGSAPYQDGIYLFDGTTLSVVADTNTPIPALTETFSGFTNPVISDGLVAFEGFGARGAGIYLFDGTTLKVVADSNTPVPGGSRNFIGFLYTVISGGNLAFEGMGDGQHGIYLASFRNLTVTPTSYDFGDVKLKKRNTTSFKVKNRGTFSISVTGTITGADPGIFKIRGGGRDNKIDKTIKPGKTSTIRVSFKPVSNGSKAATLEITSNDPNTPTMDIVLTGTAQ